MKIHYHLLFICLIMGASTPTSSCQTKVNGGIYSQFSNYLSVPVAGNSWVLNATENQYNVISDSGVKDWKNPSTQIKAYFRTGRIGNIQPVSYTHLRAHETGRNLVC